MTSVQRFVACLFLFLTPAFSALGNGSMAIFDDPPISGASEPVGWKLRTGLPREREFIAHPFTAPAAGILGSLTVPVLVDPRLKSDWYSYEFDVLYWKSSDIQYLQDGARAIHYDITPQHSPEYHLDIHSVPIDRVWTIFSGSRAVRIMDEGSYDGRELLTVSLDLSADPLEVQPGDQGAIAFSYQGSSDGNPFENYLTASELAAAGPGYHFTTSSWYGGPSGFVDLGWAPAGSLTLITPEPTGLGLLALLGISCGRSRRR